MAHIPDIYFCTLWDGMYFTWRRAGVENGQVPTADSVYVVSATAEQLRA